MADIKKGSNVANDTGSGYSNVTDTQAKINNIQERFDDTTDNDNPYDGAIQYINRKTEEVIDLVNLLEVNSSDGASVATYALKLKSNPRIGGVQFSGTGDINLPGVNIAGNQNTSGNAGTVTNGVYTTGNQTIAGTKTFSSTIAGSVSGNAATATNAKGYKGSNTNYKLVPADFYMMNSTSNYANGIITIPSGGECHAQVSLPVGSSITKQNTIVYTNSVGSGAVEVWIVPFDGVSNPAIKVGSGLLGKDIKLDDGGKFNASEYYLWIKINLSDDDNALRVYGGNIGFKNA